MPHDVLTISESSEILRDVMTGLRSRPKRTSSKYLYDKVGSELFDIICRIPEYHVTRTEMALLERIAPEIGTGIVSGSVLVEFGSGASHKTCLILDAAPHVTAYVPIDISAAALQLGGARIAARYPYMSVWSVEDDFLTAQTLPAMTDDRLRFGFFPGSTLGNFAPAEATAFLSHARRLLGAGASMLVGIDLTRSPTQLQEAYDDAAGITAAFNLNLLVRLNRECGADFNIAHFTHRADWNGAEGRVEMHLVSGRDQSVVIGGEEIQFLAGETIHTENSYKYLPETFKRMATDAGWAIRQEWIGIDPLATHADAPSIGVFLLST